MDSVKAAIHVVDSIMGSGKTSSAINFINSLPSDTKFMFVAPYLSEVQRIADACWFKNVKRPIYLDGKKINSLYNLLQNGENIVTTHALFQRIGQEGIDSIKRNGYICFIDETIDCIVPYDQDNDGLNAFDTEALLTAYVDVDESNMVKWKNEKYHGVFSAHKVLADNRQLVKYNDKLLMKVFRLDILLAFKEIYVMTYLFEGSFMSSYFKYFGLEYDNLYITGNGIDTYSFTGDKSKETVPRKDYRKLITIIDIDRMNEIGNGEYDLSYSWYKRVGNADKLEQMQKNLHNFFIEIVGSKSSRNLWTTFNAFKGRLSGKGYAKGYVAINTRASNEHINRDVVAYTVNRFVNPNISNFFKGRGIEQDEDLFALSEMIQCIWRSSIRRDDTIILYIPSRRMRKLLQNWIEQNSVSE